MKNNRNPFVTFINFFITSFFLIFYFLTDSPKIIAQEHLSNPHQETNAITLINPLFGPEFTFTNNEIIKDGNINSIGLVRTPKSAEFMNLWRKKMLEICQIKNCREIKQIDRYGLTIYRYVYPDGFHYTLTTDPHVIEINMIPLTIDGVIHHQKTIEEDIFNLAKSLGLFPHEYYGGGSIHMDVASAFGEDADLFMDFFMDYSNHFQLSMNAMGKYLDNAPPVLKLPKENIDWLRTIHEIHKRRKRSINELSGMIIRNVYTSTYYNNYNPPEKYQALNLDKIIQNNPAHRTMEIRGIRAQESVDEYIKILRIFRARVNFLNLRRKYNLPPVELLPSIPEIGSEESKFYNREPLDQIYHYIKESGLDWQEFKFLQIRHGLYGWKDDYKVKPLRETPGCLSQQDRRLGQPEEMIKDFLKLRAKL